MPPLPAMRRWRIFRWGAAVFIVLLGVLTVLYMVVLPRVVRSEIQAALRGVGVQKSMFELREVSWRSTRVFGITLGDPTWLTADSIETNYSLSNLWDQRVGAMTITGAVWNVVVKDGVIDWGPVFPAASAVGGVMDLPVDRMELVRCVVNVDRDGEVMSLPVEGSIVRTGPGQFAVSLKTVIADEAAVINAMVDDQGSMVMVKTDAVGTSVPADSLKAKVAWARTPASLPHAVEVEFLRHALQMSIGDEHLTMANVGGSASVKMDADFVPMGFESDVTCETASFAGHLAREVAVSLSPDTASIHMGEISIETSERFTASDVTFNATNSGDLPLFAVQRQQGEFRAEIHGGIRLAAPVSLVGETMRAAINNLELETAATIGGDGSFTATGQVDLGECALSPFVANSGTIVASVAGTNEISVQHAAIDLGPHGRFRADPFRFNPANVSIIADVACENLELSSWLPLLSRDEITGAGQVQGRIQLVLDAGNPELPMSFGAGYLMADPPTGWVQVADPSIVEGLLAGYDFGSMDIDLSLTDLKDRIVSTLQDFSFDSLHVDFEPVERPGALQIEIAGKGRQGVEPIPIGGLTVNVNDFDRVFNDAIRLKTGYDRLTK